MYQPTNFELNGFNQTKQRNKQTSFYVAYELISVAVALTKPSLDIRYLEIVCAHMDIVRLCFSRKFQRHLSRRVFPILFLQQTLMGI